MRAQELANDLAHALEVVEAERDEAIRERDEAQAVIDAVREARLAIVAQITYEVAIEAGTWTINGIGAPMGRRERTRAAAFCRALRLLDEVDGL